MFLKHLEWEQLEKVHEGTGIKNNKCPFLASQKVNLSHQIKQRSLPVQKYFMGRFIITLFSQLLEIKKHTILNKITKEQLHSNWMVDASTNAVLKLQT